jgi:cyclic pyranopterin phosphate synthase
LKPSYTPNNSLRIKIENACNLCCNFCHNEGSPDASRMKLNQIEEIIHFAKKYGYEKIHLTGGEPTLHPQIHAIVSHIKESGLYCAMTSNGQCQKMILDQLLVAGLDSINFSFSTTNLSEWAARQSGTSLQLAHRQMGNLLSAVSRSIDIGLRTKLNVVVGNDYKDAVEVIKGFSISNVEIRLLDILGDKQSSENIRRTLGYLGALTLEVIETLGSSQVKCLYDTAIGRLAVKNIHRYQLPSICSGCHEPCYEGVYGIRIESRDDILWVRLCIHRECSQTLHRLDAFSDSSQFAEFYAVSGIRHTEEEPITCGTK